MSEFMKIGGKTPNGLSKGINVDYNGNVLCSKDYIPKVGFNHADNLVEERKIIKSRYIESEISVGDDFSDWATTSTGTVTKDFVKKEDGEFSVKLSPSSTGYFNPICNFDEPLDLSDIDHIRFWMYSNNTSAIDRVWIHLLTDADNYFYINVLNGLTFRFGESELTYHKDVWQSVGSPNISNITKIRLQIKVSDTSTYINIQNINFVKQKPKNGKLVMRFDDGLASVIDLAMPILRKYGVVGTCYVLPE